VDAPSAAQLELEMLDGIGDVDLAPIDAQLREGPLEELPGRADERAAAQIFLVAGLLADEHEAGPRGAFAGHRLRRLFAERAVAAAFERSAQVRQRRRRAILRWRGVASWSGFSVLRAGARSPRHLVRGHPVRVEGRRPEGPDADWIHLPDPVADAIKGLASRIAALEQALEAATGAAQGEPADVHTLSLRREVGGRANPAYGPNPAGG